MFFKLQNWKLAILALIGICLFMYLGFWQLSRANYKKVLLKTFADRSATLPLNAHQFDANLDQRYYRLKLKGHFDSQHALYLDNKTFHGEVGYEVYVPFQATGLTQAILVDLGFIRMGLNRNELPKAPAVIGDRDLTGMLNLPPTYVALGAIHEPSVITWPLRIEFVNLTELAKLLNYPLQPYILQIDPQSPYALPIEWQIVIMGPEKHRGYAVQWFALALTLLILFVALNRIRH